MKWAEFSRKAKELRLLKGSGASNSAQRKAATLAAAQTFSSDATPTPAVAPTNQNSATTTPPGSNPPVTNNDTAPPGTQAKGGGGASDEAGLDKVLKPIFSIVFLSCVMFLKFVQDIFKGTFELFFFFVTSNAN